jgi:hypothetical protein
MILLNGIIAELHTEQDNRIHELKSIIRSVQKWFLVQEERAIHAHLSIQICSTESLIRSYRGSIGFANLT